MAIYQFSRIAQIQLHHINAEITVQALLPFLLSIADWERFPGRKYSVPSPCRSIILLKERPVGPVTLLG
jgi:hypothetical protein